MVNEPNHFETAAPMFSRSERRVCVGEMTTLQRRVDEATTDGDEDEENDVDNGEETDKAENTPRYQYDGYTCNRPPLRNTSANSATTPELRIPKFGSIGSKHALS